MNTSISEWKEIKHNLPEGVVLDEAGEKHLNDAASELEHFVTAFNAAYRLWERSTKCGANFRFRYEAQSGKKFMVIEDVSPEWPDKPSKDDPRLKAAEEVIQKADESLNPR